MDGDAFNPLMYLLGLKEVPAEVVEQALRFAAIAQPKYPDEKVRAALVEDWRPDIKALWLDRLQAVEVEAPRIQLAGNRAQGSPFALFVAIVVPRGDFETQFGDLDELFPGDLDEPTMQAHIERALSVALLACIHCQIDALLAEEQIAQAIAAMGKVGVHWKVKPELQLSRHVTSGSVIATVRARGLLLPQRSGDAYAK